MVLKKEFSYTLAPYTQVREEDFGLLFYTMKGPRLYFLSSGKLLDSSFFESDLSLVQWLEMKKVKQSVSEKTISAIRKMLERLKEKGVIIER